MVLIRAARRLRHMNQKSLCVQSPVPLYLALPLEVIIPSILTRWCPKCVLRDMSVPSPKGDGINTREP